jgi:hypothetical protein
MTTEPTVPQSDLGPAPANGQGQSQGHRRRRRRRKNKSHQPGMQGQQGQQNSPSPVQPQMQAPPPQQQPQGGGQKQGSGRHRKKKKFFPQKNSGPQAQPGNSIAPQHGRRKEKQRGPRMFVGPMDHSYRAVNGNVADGPPSTIPLSGNGHHTNYHDVNVGTPNVPVRADAPTRIFCFIDDLFFQAKIQETAKKLGVKVEFAKGEKDTVSRILDTPEDAKPTLLVFDLNNLNAKPMTLIPKFKSKFKRATSIVGFLNHLQGDLKMKAVEAGCDTVMPRSAFSQSLPNLLRRYGLEEEDEYASQPM